MTSQVVTGEGAVVIIPTYNEKANLPIIVESVLRTIPLAKILVVDDSSPDGTGALADEMSREDARINVLHRKEKNGLGAAYLAGFSWALKAQAQVIIEMDADGSHPASALPELIRATTDNPNVGLSIGSRWVATGGVVNWPLSRKMISKTGSWYARVMLGLKIRDITAGFRAFKRSTLEAISLETVESAGYCFQIDMTRRVSHAGIGIVEIPIIFRERELGESKMSTGIVLEAMRRVTAWGIQRLVHNDRKP